MELLFNSISLLSMTMLGSSFSSLACSTNVGWAIDEITSIIFSLYFSAYSFMSPVGHGNSSNIPSAPSFVTHPA